jgi:hypothetical protein
MIIIEFLLQEGSHLGEFLVTLSLDALYEIHEFSVVLICYS